MESGRRRLKELALSGGIHMPGTSSWRTQAPWRLSCWKTILGILLAGSIVLKLAVVVIIFSAYQCTSKDKQSGKKQGSNLPENESCTPAIENVFANVLLDPATAHQALTISKNLREVRWKGSSTHVTNNLERFSNYPCVLGQGGFTSGIHWWEVQVLAGHHWVLGVARESIERNEPFVYRKNWSYWVIGNQCSSCNDFAFHFASIGVFQNVTRIKVSVNYDRGQVLFFDVDWGFQVHALAADFLGEKIYPFFCVMFNTHLRLSHCLP
ncbi:E3 ubiquitin-protein ligase TRIM21-like [Varanus komodoensis]|uniref:E3 ubiquitin-protein ligase TRIM21-like n=1 Tax=Varanus komodoensis TaxID=61221 RepID=UPI001CF7C6D4|nr:E3 ubiquitin-protein ligase TRIM21-like [Varanus komodoensis]